MHVEPRRATWTFMTSTWFSLGAPEESISSSTGAFETRVSAWDIQRGELIVLLIEARMNNAYQLSS